MEQRGRADQIAARLKRNAALGLGSFELVHGGEVAIGQDAVAQRPEVLSRL
jgi:hypothetical protein